MSNNTKFAFASLIFIVGCVIIYQNTLHDTIFYTGMITGGIGIIVLGILLSMGRPHWFMAPKEPRTTIIIALLIAILVPCLAAAILIISSMDESADRFISGFLIVAFPLLLGMIALVQLDRDRNTRY